MRINRVQNISYTGRIKSGDIKKAASKVTAKLEECYAKIEAKTAKSIDKTYEKLRIDPENLKPVDYAKLSAVDSSIASTSTASTSGFVTTYENTWPIYSTIFPSSF